MTTISYITTATLSLALMGLSGCNTTNSQPANEKAMDNTSETSVSQCGPYDENAGMKICTAHFDPVCVKEKDTSGKISYRTAGNSCSACSSPQAISYTPGECK